MKRVVNRLYEEVDEVGFQRCSDDFSYLVYHKHTKQWGIIQRTHYDDGTYVIMCFDELTAGNHFATVMTDKLPELMTDILKQFDVFEFPTFRAAMQYYIEQTKEVEGE